MTNIEEFEKLLGKAIQERAKELPSGYAVKIILTTRGFSVSLIVATDEGTEVLRMFPAGDGMIANIELAVDMAKESDAPH